jgi:hypothetical protein
MKTFKSFVSEEKVDNKPVVHYSHLPKDKVKGRHTFTVVKSEHPLWKKGETFNDDDMSMGSKQVRFKLHEEE